jgi:hypothetical protein
MTQFEKRFFFRCRENRNAFTATPTQEQAANNITSHKASSSEFGMNPQAHNKSKHLLHPPSILSHARFQNKQTNN